MIKLGRLVWICILGMPMEICILGMNEWVETGKCRANVRKWTINNETKESEKRLFNIYILRSILVQFIFGDQRLVGKDDVFYVTNTSWLTNQNGARSFVPRLFIDLNDANWRTPTSKRCVGLKLIKEKYKNKLFIFHHFIMERLSRNRGFNLETLTDFSRL